MSDRASRGEGSHSRPILARALLALVLALSLGWTTGLSPASVGAAGIVVTTTADTIDASAICDDVMISNLPGPGDGLVSLREAICAANNTAGDDVITFNLPGSAPWVITLQAGELLITHNLTINGPGEAALSIVGDGKSRIFNNTGTTVAISGLTVTNGGGGIEGGGAILNSGGLTLTDVTVSDSGAFGGGGILNWGTLNLVRVTVTGNDAFIGGGIANYNILTASDSVISDNGAGAAGGGLYNAGEAELTDTTVTDNTAIAGQGNSSGGGIASGSSIGPSSAAVPAASTPPGLTLTRVTVTDNAATEGGGVALAASPVRPTEVTPGQTTIDESTIADNEACFGGGIASDLAPLAITNSTISGNQAKANGDNDILCPGDGNNGGGIWANGALTVTNSTVSGNSAEDSGGGFYLSGTIGGGAPVMITYSTVTGNHADTDADESVDGGGGIFYSYLQTQATPALVAQEVTINSSIVAGNTGPAGEEDCDGTVGSNGHNLVGQGTGCPSSGTGDLTTSDIATVLNTTLADNGGPTKTHALVKDSPALDAGDPATCTEIAQSRDQRGITRPVGAGCDIGAYEAALLTLTVQTEGNGTVAVSPTPSSSSGTPDNMTYGYPAGTVVTLTATPGNGQILARWTIDGAGTLPYGKGWATPLTITLDENHTANATFAARPAFSDVPSSHPAYIPITDLTARGIIKGYDGAGCMDLGVPSPCFGPDDLTERAQVAALLTRLLGLEGENHGNGGFTDLGDLSPELQRAVGTMAHYDIMVGYGDGKFGPFDKISYLQTVQVISRGFVFKGYWTKATVDDPTIYPNVVLSHDERLDLVTFVQNAGLLPGFANTTGRAPLDLAAPRDWTAEALWQALNSFFSVDQPGKGGFVP
jgi:S-layer homology domain